MFLEVQGPTALRAPMVRSLAFSADPVQVVTPNRSQRCLAAVGAVWNGDEGFVIVLLRSLDEPVVHRFACADALRSEADLRNAVDEGIRFAASLGFTLDDPEFLGLSDPERQSRLDRWNRLRKPERSADEESAPVHGQSEASEGSSGAAHGAVLGRIELVRRGEEDRGATLARLFAFF